VGEFKREKQRRVLHQSLAGQVLLQVEAGQIVHGVPDGRQQGLEIEGFLEDSPDIQIDKLLVDLLIHQTRSEQHPGLGFDFQ
jgi:hypothetical protein